MWLVTSIRRIVIPGFLFTMLWNNALSFITYIMFNPSNLKAVENSSLSQTPRRLNSNIAFAYQFLQSSFLWVISDQRLRVLRVRHYPSAVLVFSSLFQIHLHLCSSVNCQLSSIESLYHSRISAFVLKFPIFFLCPLFLSSSSIHRTGASPTSFSVHWRTIDTDVISTSVLYVAAGWANCERDGDPGEKHCNSLLSQ